MRIRTPPGSAVAFAPAHVTGLFAPRLEAADPRARGSIGAGLVLDVGVTARAHLGSSSRPSVRLRSDVGPDLPISREVAQRLLRERPGRLEVELTHDLPVGQGFGMSAAGALATALAVGKLFGVQRERSTAIAHLADLYGGGGLGGVAAILGGGFEMRRKPGVPPWGTVEHRPFRRPIVLVVAGPPIPSPPLLRDGEFRAKVVRAAGRGCRRLLLRPTADQFLEESERFADALGLLDARLRRVIRSLRTPDVRVSQAMFGRSLFAVARTPAAQQRLIQRLSDLGQSCAVVGASGTGAKLVARPSSVSRLGGRAVRRDWIRGPGDRAPAPGGNR